MQIVVKLYGNLRRFLPSGTDVVDLDLAPGARVEEALKILGIPDSEVWAVSVNGELADQDRKLGQGDTMDVFAPIAGGQNTPHFQLPKGACER